MDRLFAHALENAWHHLMDQLDYSVIYTATCHFKFQTEDYCKIFRILRLRDFHGKRTKK